MAISFAYPWFLSLLLLAALPFWRSRYRAENYSSLIMLPKDRLSTLVIASLKILASTIIMLLVTGLAEPYYRENQIEKIGTGAHIVILLDRSASMNENFSGSYFGGQAKNSKVAVARDMLSKFIARRQHDLFGMISFSTSPIHVLPMTQDRLAINAAIKATRSRGRGVTNIAPGLSMALDYFIDREHTGSRVILLVSDGAARIETETQATLSKLFKQHKVILYWIYLKNAKSGSLTERPKNANETTTPEYFLHQYFQQMGIPYQAFEAQNPNALQRAIEEIEKLQNEPIIYQQKIPRKSLSGLLYLWAILLLIVFSILLKLLQPKRTLLH